VKEISEIPLGGYGREMIAASVPSQRLRSVAVSGSFGRFIRAIDGAAITGYISLKQLRVSLNHLRLNVKQKSEQDALASIVTLKAGALDGHSWHLEV